MTRCAVFCYTISARVIRGSALLGSAISSRGLWAQNDFYKKSQARLDLSESRV